MGYKDSLEKNFDTYINKIGKQFMAFPWENRDAYAGWLAQTYYFVKHTTSLVCLSAVQFGAKDREHHYHMLTHLADERGHDMLAFNDLKHLGYGLSDFPEMPETSVFYQNQYYMIQYQGPSAHLGYSLCLEGLAAKFCPDVYKKVEKLYGRDCSSFINIHANVDQDHFAAGSAELKYLNDEQASVVTKNLEQSSLLYGHILSNIEKKVKATRAA